MKFVTMYLREHIGMILLQVGFAGIFAGVFYLYQLPMEAVLFPMGICAVIGLLYMLFSMHRAYQKHQQLRRIQRWTGEVLEDSLGEANSILEEDYQKLLRMICLEKRQMEEKQQSANQEMLAYFTMWVHQIKTPITSMQLYLKEEDSSLSRKCNSDLLHIKQYVDMVLNYIRLGAESTDYVFRKVELDRLLGEVIRKLRGDFIMKRLELVYQKTNATVISDEKWLSFVVEQILSNALKYTSTGAVCIYMKDTNILCIEDTGMGIAPEDMPRIFEKGYTGINGHESKQSSGIGLYLCKQICDRLGHIITVDSEIGKGTVFQINLEQKHI